MIVDIEDRDGIKLLHLEGELTGGEENILVDTVTDLLASPNARIVLELGKVQYMNSAGLSDLVRLVAQANVQEARVILANPSPHLAGVLEMTKLDRFFEIHSSADEAVQTLAQPTRAG